MAKISEMSWEAVSEYIRTEEEDLQPSVLLMAMESATAYIVGYTGLTEEQLDEYEDLTTAWIILCQDIYDNRTLHPDTKYANSTNKTVESILGMHTRNLI